MLNWRILTGDVRETLKSLPDGCVQTCVTSPPYWGLRCYGHDAQLGLESTPEAYTASLVAVFADVRRVLDDNGTVWLNLGDSYAANGPGGDQKAGLRRAQFGIAYGHQVEAEKEKLKLQKDRRVPQGLKVKDLVGIPWRVAFALQADGWYLRSDIIWSKPNPMPESVQDRPTKSHEYIFLLSKSARYFYDAEAIAEAFADERMGNPGAYESTTAAALKSDTGRGRRYLNIGKPWNADGAKATRNKRSVWHVATQPYADAHFATFPEALIEPCILAGSKPGDTVLDPFTGSGTTGAVAIRHQRNFIGCELNPAYVALAEKRIGAVAPLFAERTA